MNKKQRNKSSERPQDNLLKHHFERKCQTPSVYQPKKKTKSKQKSTEKKPHQQSIKQMKAMEANVNITIPKKQSPFKHKHRPISNLANVRHAKNIQHQLSNLNQSAFRNQSSYLEDSHKKVRYDPTIQKIIDEGKKYMKNNNYEKSMKLFKDCLQKDPENIEALYLLGLSCYHLQYYQDVINTLTNVLIKDDHYRKNVYLFLAIAQKKIGSPEDAILTLTKAIAFYPKYYDALILRAKILSKQKRFYDAVEDLNKCIKIQPQNIQAYITKADCLRSLTQYKESINIYSQILKSKLDLEILLKRSIAYIDNGNIAEALVDLNLIISKSHNNSQAFLFKGQAYSKINNYNEAILSYEQAIKFNTSKRATTKALYEITKLKIDLGDYYGASYTLERANSLEVEPKVLDRMKIFTDGSTSIMKKKFKKGIQNLSILAKKQNLSDQLRPLLYSFRSYGYFCQHKFSNAINDLNNLVKLGYKLDKPCNYNYSILQGIIACQNNQFSQAIQKFDEANLKRKDFVDPFLYKGLTRICEYNRNPKTKKSSLLEEALLHISSTLEKDDNANSYYICACILYEMKEYEEAFQYVEKAIDKAQDHSMKYLYLKAMIQGMLGQYKQAYKGFYNVLSVLASLKEKETIDPDQPQQQKQIPQTYLNRAKCYLLFGQKKKAFQDLQTYIAKKPLDSQVHSVAGQLLFSIGAFDDAVKAYNYSPNIEKHAQTLLQRLKCYLLLKELNYCLKDMQKLADLGSQQVRYDYYCLDALKQASKASEQAYTQALAKISYIDIHLSKENNGIIFKKSDQMFYKGFFYFQLKNYEECLKLFIKAKTLKALNNELKMLEQGDDYEDQFDNCIFTDKQIQYNIAIVQLMLGKEQNAHQVLSQFQQFKSYQEDSEEIGDLTPFPVSNRLCSIFPSTNFNNKFKFRLSFCLPQVTPPEIKFQIDEKILKDLSMSSTEPRPDAPWIKRNSHGVIFTDEIVGFDVDLRTEKSLGAIKIETEEQNQEKNKLKELLCLDAQVEEKLDKLMAKNKK